MIRIVFLLLLALAPASADVLNSAPCWIQDAAAAGTNVWLLCDRSQVYRSTDNGATWQHSQVPVGTRLRAVRFLDARKGFIAGDQGILLASDDGGRSWRRVAIPADDDLLALSSVGRSIWASGYGGTILHSGDGGVTWKRQISGTTFALESIFFYDKAHGWAVGWNGEILRTTDGGNEWRQVASPEAKWSLSSVYFEDAETGWAVGFQGQILRTGDGGQTWSAQPAPAPDWYESVIFDRSGRGWITAGRDLLVSEDGGKSWHALGLDEGLFFDRLIPVNGAIWAIGPMGVLRNEGGATTAWQKLGTLKAG